MEYDNPTKKLVKYALMFIVVYIACLYVPENKPSTNESVIISAIASVSYAFMETYYPTVSL